MLIRLLAISFVAAVTLVAGAPSASADTFHEGSFDLRPSEACISETARAEIHAELARNIARLGSEGAFADLEADAKTAATMIFPLRAAEGFSDYGFHFTVSFVDHAQEFGVREDYECGSRTTDGSTVGWHRGTDYNIWPFHWNKMDAKEVEVVAARDGIVVSRTDGLDDRSCPGNGLNSAGNAIYLRHSDGSIAWYVHMKKGSVVQKQVGQFVVAGEYLGVVGSSGSSISPHLHFEIRDQQNDVIDPYAGPCNQLNSESWWIDQPAYLQPGALKISTHQAPVLWGDCPNRDRTFESNQFEPGDKIWYYLFGRDATEGDLFEYTVVDPDGEVFRAWDLLFTNAYQDNYFQSWERSIPENAKPGTYRFELRYRGQTYDSYFTVGSQVPVLFQSTEARIVDEGVLIRWTTVTDEPVRGFQVRRARPGQGLSSIATVAQLPPDVTFWVDREVAFGETYEYTVSLVNGDGSEIAASPMRVSVPRATAVLAPGYPNPFNPSTTIAFTLEVRERARIDVYDLVGRHVTRLHDGVLPAGHHRVQWDGRDDTRRTASSGVYVVRLSTPSVSLSRKLVLVE